MFYFYLWAVGLVVLNAVWLALDLLSLPGNWLMIASAAAVAWVGPGHRMFSPWTLVALVVLAMIGEILEFVSGLAGARKAGASKRGSGGALLGGMVGGIIGTFVIPVPVIGSLLGAGAGAAAGAILFELSGGRGLRLSAKSGAGAGAGRLLGTLIKLLVGALIWIIIAVAAFWP